MARTHKEEDEEVVKELHEGALWSKTDTTSTGGFSSVSASGSSVVGRVDILLAC